MEKLKPIIEEEIINHGCVIAYFCNYCEKETSTPKIFIVKRIGKGRYKPIESFCSEQCFKLKRKKVR